MHASRLPWWLGPLFSVLWASSTVATKFGVQSASPLLLSTLRFFCAGTVLLVGLAILYPSAWRWPKRLDWLPLLILGLCNSALFLGAFSYAISQVSVGLVSLCVGVNPLLMIVFGALLTKRRILTNEWQGMSFAIVGMGLALVPQWGNVRATAPGLLVLVGGLIAFSIGSLYYNRTGLSHRLPAPMVNGWQLLFGGVILLPVAFTWENARGIQWDLNLAFSLTWLVGINSICSMLLLYTILRHDPVEAGKWLLPPPLLGLLFAGLLLGEAISSWMLAGGLLLVLGMYRAQRPDGFALPRRKNH